MPKRLAPWSLLLALVAGGVVLWWVGGGEVLPPAGAGAGAREAAGAVPPAPLLPPPASSAANERAAASPASHFPIPPDAEWIELRVLDGQSGGLVADAEVVWLDAPGGGLPWEIRKHLPPDEAERLSNDREAAAREYGSSAHSDANGRVRVAIAGHAARFFARSVGHYGELTVQANGLPPPGGHRLLVFPEHELRVAVLDADGHPAIGVPVRVVHDGDPERVDGSPIRYECARTVAPGGLARLVHLQDRLQAVGDRTRGWRVRVELPFLTDVSAPFDPGALPAEPLVLHLPPTGRVLARTVFEGRRSDHRDTILLFPDEPGALRNENRAAWRESEPDGLVCFRHVPLGRRFVLRASLAGWVERPIAGPVAAGETVRVEIAAPERPVLFAGRFVDASGAPLRNVDASLLFEARFGSGGGFSSGATLQADEGGRFRHFAGGARDPDLVYTRLDVSCERPDGPPLRAKLGPRSFPAGTTELGDVVLEAGPVLVAGRLQFPPGVRPFEAQIVVHFPRQEAEQAMLGLTVDEEGIGTAWQGPGGQFAVLAPLGEALPTCPGELKVRVGWTDAHAPVSFPVGQRDLVVPVDLGAGLWATVRLPDGACGEHRLALSGRLSTASGRLEGHASPEPHEPGVVALHWQHVARGRYTLELRIRGVGAPLVSIPEVDVPGPAGGDPRLLGIDLRPLLQVATVRVTTEPPFVDRLPAATVTTRDPQFGFFLLRDGVASLLLPAGPQELLVKCPGLQAVALHDVQGEATAVLRPWPEVPLSFPDLPPLPEGVELLARCAGAAEDTQSEQLQPTAPRRIADGQVTLPYGPGPLALELTAKLLYHTRAFRLDLPHPFPPGAAPVVVRVPAAQLQKVLDQLAEDAGR